MTPHFWAKRVIEFSIRRGVNREVLNGDVDNGLYYYDCGVSRHSSTEQNSCLDFPKHVTASDDCCVIRTGPSDTMWYRARQHEDGIPWRTLRRRSFYFGVAELHGRVTSCALHFNAELVPGQQSGTRAHCGLRVERIDPLRFLAAGGCRKTTKPGCVCPVSFECVCVVVIRTTFCVASVYVIVCVLSPGCSD